MHWQHCECRRVQQLNFHNLHMQQKFALISQLADQSTATTTIVRLLPCILNANCKKICCLVFRHKQRILHADRGKDQSDRPTDNPSRSPSPRQSHQINMRAACLSAWFLRFGGHSLTHWLISVSSRRYLLSLLALSRCRSGARRSGPSRVSKKIGCPLTGPAKWAKNVATVFAGYSSQDAKNATKTISCIQMPERCTA